MKKIFILFISLITLSFSDGYSQSGDCDPDWYKDAWLEKLIDDLESPGGEKLRQAIRENPQIIDAWRAADKAGIDKAIRTNPEYLKTINKYPFGTTGKKKILDNATDQEWEHLLSGKLVDVPETNVTVSNKLKDKFGSNTQTSKKYDTDPTIKEFDGVTEKYFIEHKEFTSNGRMSKSGREQMDFQMKSCKVKGKDNFLMIEGVANDDYINRAIRKANDFKVNTKIEINGVIVHDIKF